MGKHTILLVQFTAAQTSRTYHDFEDVSLAMDGIIKMHEQKLKQLQPSVSRITYDVRDLFTYVDTLSDLSCLVFNPDTNTYVPYGKEWIKTRVFQHLKRQAS